MLTPGVAIVGIGIHPFGRTGKVPARQQGAVAARAALQDAGLEWTDMQFAVGGTIEGGTADSLVNELGLTGLSFSNVTNGCATGGSVLAAAATTLMSGAHEVGLVVGFDAHPAGAFGIDPGILGLQPWYGASGLMVAPQYFALKAQRYMYEHGISPETLGRVAHKAFSNGARNPNAWRRTIPSLGEILGARMICPPLTQYMFCAPSEGAVALVLRRADGTAPALDRSVRLRAIAVRSRRYGSFDVWSPSLPLEQAPSPVVFAARDVFESSGIGPDDIDIAQVQDTDSASEVMHLAECGFCKDGEQEELLARGETLVTGRLPVNTDGGCLANGEPIGASGLRQVYECVLQLRGEAGDRQVRSRARTAFTQVYGAPGVAACTILSR